jgi:hypothetical protein
LAERDSEVHEVELDLRQVVFPVVSMAAAEGEEASRPMVYGTTFCVGPGLFLTAGHVIESAGNDGHIAIGYESEGDTPAIGIARAVKVEHLRGYDLGLIVAPVPEAIALLDWQDEPLRLLSDVESIGFPYSVDYDEERRHWKMAMRAFKGYVITRRKIWRLPARPVGYEIDCPFHPGLSGAPLLHRERQSGRTRLIGVVLAEGRIKFGGRRICFGEAIDVIAVGSIKSETIGGTFSELREHLLHAEDATPPR